MSRSQADCEEYFIILSAHAVSSMMNSFGMNELERITMGQALLF